MITSTGLDSRIQYRPLNFRAIVLFVCVTPLLIISMSAPINAQLIVAHRGASHDAPENTLAAFNLAWEQGADGIEGDFYLSSDGHVICIHDDTTGRTADENLVVAKSTLAELKKLDVGSWKDKKYAGQRIPTLSEVIATLPKGKRIVIELKIGPEIVAPLERTIKASKLNPEQVLIISFNEKTIAESKRLLPHIKAHWLTSYKSENDEGPWAPDADTLIKKIKRIKADGIGSHANEDAFSQSTIATLQKAGITEFHVWTVDDPRIAKQYKQLGAFGITTNRPAFIRDSLSKD